MTDAAQASRRVLVFAVAGRTHCCELEQVREIVPILPTTRLPGAPAFVRGLINLRGNLVTVLMQPCVFTAFPPTTAPPACCSWGVALHGHTLLALPLSLEGDWPI